jgi:carbon monoxide dehydrogenase subunit G
LAIEIEETFEVAAPVEAVWRFLMDPRQVVTCMPGAELEQVVDERTFLGAVKVKVGAITTRYQGRIRLADVDEARRSVRMLAEGRETGGGTAKGSIAAHLDALEGGATRVVTAASIDLTGRVMQMGRGMIQGVSHQLFLQFVESARRRLESPVAAGAEVGETPAQAAPISVLPLLLRSAWQGLLALLRRLLGRPPA